MVLRADAERLLCVLVQVLDERGVAAGRRADLVLDRVQHFNVQQLELGEKNKRLHASMSVNVLTNTEPGPGFRLDVSEMLVIRWIQS